MRAPMQAGDFPFPVKYGYGAVARVEDGPTDLAGRAVVCLYPHQERFNAPIAALTPVPDGVPPRRAVLAPNMETALNALWDSGASAGTASSWSAAARSACSSRRSPRVCPARR